MKEFAIKLAKNLLLVVLDIVFTVTVVSSILFYFAPYGSFAIASTLGLGVGSVLIDMVVFLAVAYLCYAAFLITIGLFLIKRFHHFVTDRINKRKEGSGTEKKEKG